MKLSINWLKDFVDIDWTPDELATQMTKIGFEIEAIDYLGKGMEKVIVGKITKIEKHPNADKLNICQVDLGDSQVQIITAATNVYEGAIVPAALDGADLPCGVHIGTTQMRGITSQGMFCSGHEICIDNSIYEGAEVDGILILKEGTPLGVSIADVIGFDDYILDVNVLSNRPDCNSVLGLAREISAVSGKQVKIPKLDYNTQKSIKSNKYIQIINNCENCNRYISHIVKDVKLKPSPLWLQKRLRAVGIRPINNIVDITNYILIEIGQPMHAFDYDLLSDKTIVIRDALENEKITCLNGEEYSLKAGDILIADKTKPLAIAGVMGGENSGINENTKTVALESASFQRANIRFVTRRIGLRSDSSARFERGVEPTLCEIGMNRALALIDMLGAGVVCDGSIDIIKKLNKESTLVADYKAINKMLSIEISAEKMKSILDSLGIKTEIKGDNLICNIPVYRNDMSSLSDIAEEIIRIYGFEHIKCTFLDKVSYTPAKSNMKLDSIRKIKDTSAILGYNEICAYPFVSLKHFDMLKIDKNSQLRNVIEVINPVNEEMRYMRTLLIHNTLQIIASNESRSIKNIHTFEIGRTYKRIGEEKPIEDTVLCIAQTGEVDFYELKGVVESLLESLNCKMEFKAESGLPFMNKNKCASVYVDGENIGYIGEVHPTVLKEFEISQKIIVAEINIENLLIKPREFDKVIAPGKSQSVIRDFTFLVPNNVSYADLYKELRTSSGKYCVEVELVDIYEGEQVPEGFKSMSFAFEFQKGDETFTSEEIEQIVSRLLKALQYKIGVKLRDIEKINK